MFQLSDIHTPQKGNFNFVSIGLDDIRQVFECSCKERGMFGLAIKVLRMGH